MNSFDLNDFYLNNVEVGWIHSAQGIRGQVYVVIASEEAAWSDKWNELILLPHEKHNKPLVAIKTKITSKKPHAKQGKWGFIIDCELIKDRNLAEEYEGYRVFVPSDFFISEPGEPIYLREVLNFQVYNLMGQFQGVVVGFSSNTAQDLLTLQFEDKTYEIPFVKELISSIDFEDKRILMDVPEGLM